MNTISTELKKDANGSPYIEVRVGSGVAVLTTIKEIEELGRTMAGAFVAAKRFRRSLSDFNSPLGETDDRTRS